MTGQGYSLPADQDELEMGGDEAKVFLSYSRKDRERAQAIADVLRERHFSVFKDTDDILPTEEWKGRLEQLISEADTIVFLLSPNSLASEVCAWEVEHARSLNKRIAPIVISEVDTGEIPPDLARLNFIFCTERDRFQDAIDNLISALNTDIDWVREHTRLAGLAKRWDAAERPARLLLRGQDIPEAEAWRDGRPEEAPLVTTLQAAYINGSRRSATRRQRITAVSSIIGLIAALGLAGFAYLQRDAAIENEAQARASEQRALSAQSLAEEQRDAAQINQSLLLTRFADQKLKNWAPVQAALLALEAMPDQRSAAALQRERPLVGEAHVMLRNAGREIAEREILLALPGSAATRNARFSLSHDERWVAVNASTENAVYVIDLTGQREMRRVVVPGVAGSQELSFNDDDTMIAAPAGKGAVQIIPLDPDEPILTLKAGEDDVSLAQFMNGGREVLTLNNTSQAQILDLKSGQVKFAAPAEIAVVSPNGERFAILHNRRISIHDANTKELLGRSENPLTDENNPAKRIKFSPGSRWLAAATENRTHLVNGRTAKFHGRTNAQDQSILAFGFGPRDDWHYVSNAKGRTDLFDINKLSRITGHRKQRGWIFDVSITDDRSTVLTSSGSGWMQLWSPHDGKVLAHIGSHLGVVNQGRVIDGGAAAISLSQDGTLRRWSLKKWVAPAIPDDKETLIDGFFGDPLYTPDRRIMALQGPGMFEVETGWRITIPGLDGRMVSYRRFDVAGRKLLAMKGKIDRAHDTWREVCLFDLDARAEPRCAVCRRYSP